MRLYVTILITLYILTWMLPFDQSWGRTFFFIMDLKKLNCNLDEYITYKQVSIYLFVGSLIQRFIFFKIEIGLLHQLLTYVYCALTGLVVINRLQISQYFNSGISSSLSVSVKYEVITLVSVSFSFGSGETEAVGCVSDSTSSMFAVV